MEVCALSQGSARLRSGPTGPSVAGFLEPEAEIELARQRQRLRPRLHRLFQWHHELDQNRIHPSGPEISQARGADDERLIGV